MRFHVLLLTLTSLFIAVLLAACASTLPSPMQPAPAEPTITPGQVTLANVRGRPGPLAGGTSAVYFSVLNGLDHDVRLVSASSPVAAVVETHETVNDNGIMRMIPQPDGFLIPARQSLKLEPGGKHIMLIDLAAPLAVGDKFPLTLSFDTGEAMSITVPVMDIVPGMSMGAEHGGEGQMMAEPEESHDDDHSDQSEEHGRVEGDHEHSASSYPPEIQEAVGALPIYEIHDLDDSLMAGMLDPNAIGLVDDFLVGLEAVTWPEELHELIDGLTALGVELRAALVAGDLTGAAELIEQLHDQAHELEFQVQQ
jgi:hypothetical protein